MLCSNLTPTITQTLSITQEIARILRLSSSLHHTLLPIFASVCSAEQRVEQLIAFSIRNRQGAMTKKEHNVMDSIKDLNKKNKITRETKFMYFSINKTKTEAPGYLAYSQGRTSRHLPQWKILRPSAFLLTYTPCTVRISRF